MGLSKSEAGKLGAIASKEEISKLKQKRIFFYERNPRKCICCELAIPYEKKNNKYCSHTCSAKISNSNRIGYKKFDRTCSQCNKTFNIKGNKFCSNDCYQLSRIDESINKFNKGELKSHAVKRILISTYGEKCLKCGWDEIHPITGKCTIELEHIDGNSKNNLPNNVTLLCPNCHSLTLTYKALNKGKGRHERMKRYNEGKSY